MIRIVWLTEKRITKLIWELGVNLLPFKEGGCAQKVQG